MDRQSSYNRDQELVQLSDTQNDKEQEEQKRRPKLPQFGITIRANVTRRVLLTLHNLLVSVSLGTRLNLHFLSNVLRNSEYIAQHMPCILVRFLSGSITAMIFQTGKIIMTGATTEYQARIISRQLARLIQRLGHPDVTYQRFVILSYNASCDMGITFNRAKLIQQFPQTNPTGGAEQQTFAAVHHQIPSLRITLLIFTTGKIIIRSRQLDVIPYALTHIYDKLTQCRAGT